MSDWKIDQDQPAMTLAAIRWYAMSIEKHAMDIYITDRAQYPAVQAALDAALDRLAQMRAEMKATALAGECPPGFENCNGICLPNCHPGA